MVVLIICYRYLKPRCGFQAVANDRYAGPKTLQAAQAIRVNEKAI